MTTSIGIAVASPGAVTGSELLRDADVALYRAKRNGKARYAVFDPDVDDGARQKVGLELELRRAIVDREFFLVFQPQIALATGRLSAVEVLLRWRHPTRGVLAPGAFIPIAEESELILPIGRWVLDEACRQAREWSDRFHAAPAVSVNLSARQFQDPNLVDDVATALWTSGLEPSCLKLEITESAVMLEPADAAMLDHLKSLGVRIAIDDFGKGYASLDYLRRFPVDEIKIDRAFVAGLGRDSGDTTIVRAVVGLAHALGLAVVAEGVETSAQVTILRELGCELAQGFLLRSPEAGFRDRPHAGRTGSAQSPARAGSLALTRIAQGIRPDSDGTLTPREVSGLGQALPAPLRGVPSVRPSWRRASKKSARRRSGPPYRTAGQNLGATPHRSHGPSRWPRLAARPRRSGSPDV